MIYIKTGHKDLLSHYNLILRKLYEKMSGKALENTNELIQYGRRIGKKVYSFTPCKGKRKFKFLVLKS